MQNWKQIDDLNYEASNTGDIRNKKTGLILKQILNKHTGYLQVNLYKNGRGKTCDVHRIIATLFVPNPNGYKVVNHEDSDRTNNSSTNLIWCTSSYNNLHAYKKGNKRGPWQDKMGLLNKASKAVIGTNVNNGNVVKFGSIAEAKRNGFISEASISACCKGYKRQYREYTWQYDL